MTGAEALPEQALTATAAITLAVVVVVVGACVIRLALEETARVRAARAVVARVARDWEGVTPVASPASTEGPVRLQQQRVAGWSVPDGAVRVSRGTPWGNPWRAGDRVALPSHEGSVLVTPELAVDLFAAWMLERPDSLEAAVDELAGFDLVCWCPIGKPCHAEWLLEQVRLRSEVRDLTFIK